MIPASGDQPPAVMRVVTSDPAMNLFESRFSPDQRWVTFIAVDAKDARVSRIFVVPAAGGAWRPVTEGHAYDDKPHWSRDGRTLYVISNRDGLFNVWGRHVDLATGEPLGTAFPVTTFTSPRHTVSGGLPRTQIAITTTALFLPITEATGELWMLDNIDR